MEELTYQNTKMVITVKSVKGSCDAHDVGDVIEIYPYRERRPFWICPEAYNAIFPYLFALKYGAPYPWAKEGRILAACPDAENCAVFEIRRERIQKGSQTVPKG